VGLINLDIGAYMLESIADPVHCTNGFVAFGPDNDCLKVSFPIMTNILASDNATGRQCDISKLIWTSYTRSCTGLP
jgi:hypothetical protein